MPIVSYLNHCQLFYLVLNPESSINYFSHNIILKGILSKILHLSRSVCLKFFYSSLWSTTLNFNSSIWFSKTLMAFLLLSNLNYFSVQINTYWSLISFCMLWLTNEKEDAHSSNGFISWRSLERHKLQDWLISCFHIIKYPVFSSPNIWGPTAHP